MSTKATDNLINNNGNLQKDWGKKHTPLSKAQKIQAIEEHFAAILQVLDLNIKDDSLKDTPRRVAKMYVNELFFGLDKKNAPSISTFQNKFNYRQMLIQQNIEVVSMCEHHFLPIIGSAHVAYIAKDRVIGLSKINRIVNYLCHRPQLQERLTQQIHQEFCKILQIDDVAVIVEANHSCVSLRGISDKQSCTKTYAYSGNFLKIDVKNEFLQAIRNSVNRSD